MLKDEASCPPLVPTLLAGHEYRMQLARYRLAVAHGHDILSLGRIKAQWYPLK